MNNHGTKIHLLNIALMAISLALAIVIPFELFLFAYAVLGPLHYLTEINWLNQKGFYLENKNGVWMLVALTFLAAIPVIFTEVFYRHAEVIGIFNLISHSYATIILLAITLCIAFVYERKPWFVFKLVAITALVIYLFRNTNIYYLVGALLPSLVHVYLFTLIFMAYGVTKTKNRAGLLEVGALAIVPIIIICMPTNKEAYVLGNKTLLTFRESNFGALNVNLGRVLNASIDRGPESFVFSAIGIKIQIFIAFAYLYHYLNWFSKVSLIGWLTNASSKKITVLILLWVISISIYFYDYRVGLAVLFFLSLLHVTLEFPLNILSIQGVVGFIIERLRLSRRENR